MKRLPQLVLVLVLLGATAAAFAVTERLKLERSPITGTQVDRVFSPVCECARDVAVISFVLRRRETVTVDILDKDRRSIRTIVRDRREPAGRVAFTWDGRDNLERVVAEARTESGRDVAGSPSSPSIEPSTLPVKAQKTKSRNADAGPVSAAIQVRRATVSWTKTP